MRRKLWVSAGVVLTVCAAALVIWISLATPGSVNNGTSRQLQPATMPTAVAAVDSADITIPSSPSASSTTVPLQNASVGSVNSIPPLTVHRLPVFHKIETPDDIPSSIPMTWAGEPIDMKVLLFRISSRLRREDWAVADLAENTLWIYQYGEHNVPGGALDSALLTANGDAIIVSSGNLIPEIFFFPDADFSAQPTPLRPARITDIPPNIAYPLSVMPDRIDSLIWMLQSEYRDKDDQQIIGTWINLINTDNGETIMHLRLEGSYHLGGIINDGLVLTGNGEILVLGRDSSKQHFTVYLAEKSTSWQDGFRIIEAYGNHIALLSHDSQEMAVFDVEKRVAQPITKPGPGVWIPNGIPVIPLASHPITQGDQFVIGFRSITGKWSLHAISLVDQSTRKLGEYPVPEPSPYKYQPEFRAVSIADRNLVLAFTDWPTNPGDFSLMNIVDDSGGLVPVFRFPDGYFVLAAA